MAERNRKHILITTPPRSNIYKAFPKRVTIPKANAPDSRVTHGMKLLSELKRSIVETNQKRENIGFEIDRADFGYYFKLESFEGQPINISSFDQSRHGGSEIVSLEGSYQKGKFVPSGAVLFLPELGIEKLVKKIETYSDDTLPKRREQRNHKAFDWIGKFRLAMLRELWTDDEESFPIGNDSVWWEIWLRRENGEELDRFRQYARLKSISLGRQYLSFDDRTIILAQAKSEQLVDAMIVMGDIAELRKPSETAEFFDNLSTFEQAEWTKDLLERIQNAPKDAPAVCLLDTGVTRAHPLLNDHLDSSDMHAWDPVWGVHDKQGHGTEMAGLSLFGDLTGPLETKAPVILSHRLESVKILPDHGNNSPPLYGAITAESIAHPEIQSPDRLRCFSMPVTTSPCNNGEASSWSSAVDALSAGREYDPQQNGFQYIKTDQGRNQRLFVLSAGNINSENSLKASGYNDHLATSDTSLIEDPAQAWNALTVGAYTEKVTINQTDYQGWSPIAAGGDLSPHSTTSLLFGKGWPIKPEVVFEGGNIGLSPTGDVDDLIGDLCLLTTSHDLKKRILTLTKATSAATAQAAKMAAQIYANYPNYWPETVRGLIVHSAKWTPLMLKKFSNTNTKNKRLMFLRRYGYGVPNLSVALWSAVDSLTLVTQSEISPYIKEKDCEIHLHKLPWPTEILADLGSELVRLKVTLSYFIEPHPGNKARLKWQTYASHGLRFELKSPTEEDEHFEKRLNKHAADEEKKSPKPKDENWFLGSASQSQGSIHSDYWDGSAVELAERNLLAIYPVKGWWADVSTTKRSRYFKEASFPSKVRYSFIVSIETKDVDIYTSVLNQVTVSV